MNNSLLYDPAYVNLVKDIIKREIAQYAIVNGDEILDKTEIANNFNNYFQVLLTK